MDWSAWVSLLGLNPSDVQAVATAIIACGGMAYAAVQAIKWVLANAFKRSLSALGAQLLSFGLAVALASATLVRYRASPLLLALGVALAAVTGPLWHDLLKKLAPEITTAKA